MHTTPPIDDIIREHADRWRAGDHVPVEDYLERHPSLRAHARLLDLIYNELIFREQGGETPDLNEYARRFPNLADDLHIQLQIDREFMPAMPATLEAAQRASSSITFPRIPGYRITDVLGRGGMGVVFRAVQTGLDRIVALKMLRTVVAPGDERIARFRAEAAAVARLRHPNIVQIYEIGETVGQPFLALEYVDGGGLDKAVGGLPQSPVDAARLLETIARAIHYAHQRGVIHRDLKPGNILISGGSRGTDPDQTLNSLGNLLIPKIADFGLAKLLDTDNGLTVTGQVVGTPAYMAPEQAAGRADETGVYTDVYALGAILFELLTGRPPFAGDNPFEVARRVLEEPLVPPRHVRADIPADLDVICRKCLEKEPSRRYPSAEALADDLHRFLNGKPILARRTGWTERGWRWAHRNPAWAITMATVALLLVVMAVGGVILSARSERARADAVTAREQAEVELWKGRISEARAIRIANRLNARRDALALLDAAAQFRVSAELRNEYIAALALPDIQLDREWPGWPDTANNIAFSADFERYAIADSSDTIVVHRVADGDVIDRVRGPGPVVHGVVMSPDGRIVASRCVVAGENGCRVLFWKWDGARYQPKWSKKVGFHTAIVFRPDSRQAVVADEEKGRIDFVDPEMGPVRPPLTIDPVADEWWLAPTLAYHPREDRLAVARNNSVRIYDLTNGKEPSQFRIAGSRHISSIAWHPDGNRLLVGWGTPHVEKLQIWDASGKGPGVNFEGHVGSGVFGRFDPTGRLVAANNWREILRVWDAGTGLLLYRHAAQTSHLAFSRDGELLGADQLGGTLRLYRVRTSKEFRTLPYEKSELGHVLKARVDHDNRLLALGNGRELSLFDLDSGKLVARRPNRGFPMAFDRPGELFLAGVDGVSVWKPNWNVETGAVRSEPRAMLGNQYASAEVYSATRSVIPYSDRSQVMVFFPWQLRKNLTLPHRDARYIVVSPDNRWLATCAYFPIEGDAASVKLWDLKSAEPTRPAKELAVGSSAHAAFSPDGKWLATATLNGGCRLWRVGDWSAGPVIGGNFPLFTPDSRSLATETGHGEVRLSDVETGQELARFASPFQSRVRPLCFSPDGGRLVVWGRDSEAVHVWELTKIREQLCACGLDW